MGRPLRWGELITARSRVIFALDDDLAAMLDFFEHGANITSEFGFCDSDRCQTFDHSGSLPCRLWRLAF